MTTPLTTVRRAKGSTGPRPAPPAPLADEARRYVVENAVRWAMNMLVDVLANHSRALAEPQREALKRAVSALADYRETP
jgi:hypothetical protein